MGIQSTLHVTEESARKAYQKVINPAADDAFFRHHGTKHFEKMLDWILSDTLYNVLLIDQASMDKALADYYSRTFGSYDSDGSTLRYELERVVRSQGMRFVHSQLARLEASEARR